MIVLIILFHFDLQLSITSCLILKLHLSWTEYLHIFIFFKQLFIFRERLFLYNLPVGWLRVLILTLLEIIKDRWVLGWLDEPLRNIINGIDVAFIIINKQLLFMLYLFDCNDPEKWYLLFIICIVLIWKIFQ